MAYDSKISWTDGTWNTFRGCSRITEGCRNCYAERMAARNLPGHRSPTTGKPFAIMTENGPRWTGEVELMESQLDIPLHWQKPRKIFVNSMSDTFHAMVPSEWLDRMFAVTALCPQHTFIIPTKRIERAREYFSEITFERWRFWMNRTVGGTNGFPNLTTIAHRNKAGGPFQFRRTREWPLPNVILLASIANQTDADRDIPILLNTPAAVRGISLEPMIGPVVVPHIESLGWVIVGGESGPGARPCNIEWIRDIVRQCREAGVACFVKQMGAVWADIRRRMFGLRKWNRAGADPAEWPAGEWPQEWPEMRRTDGR